VSELAQELIQQALDQDFNKASKTFGDIMSVKVQDALDQEKIRLADQIYNGADPDGEDDDDIMGDEDGDDQLELDLETEGESESEEEDDEEDEFTDEDEEDDYDDENS